MTTKTSDIPATRQRAGARRAVDVVYGYLAAFFVLGVLFQVYRSAPHNRSRTARSSA